MALLHTPELENSVADIQNHVIAHYSQFEELALSTMQHVPNPSNNPTAHHNRVVTITQLDLEVDEWLGEGGKWKRKTATY